MDKKRILIVDSKDKTVATASFLRCCEAESDGGSEPAWRVRSKETDHHFYRLLVIGLLRILPMACSSFQRV